MDANSGLIIASALLILFSIVLAGGGCRCKPGRLWMLEKKVDAILKHLNIQVELDAVDREIVDLLKAGKKIEAIKLYRQHSGVGLKEAKDYVESIQV